MNGSASDLARVALGLCDAHVHGIEPEQAMQQRYGASPRHRHLVDLFAKAAVQTHTTQTGAPGAELEGSFLVAAEFAAQTRALSLLGQLTAARRAPFYVPVPYVGTRSRFSFVLEGAKIPAAKPTFLANAMLGPRSIKGICVISKELAKAPQAVDVLTRIMTDGVVEGIDVALTDAGAASATRPGSLVSLADEVYTGAALTTVTAADNLLRTMVQHLLSIGGSLRRSAWLTSSTAAVGFAMLRDSSDALAYPGITAAGGTLLGLPLHASDYATVDTLILVDADALVIADEDAARIVVSDSAMVYMSDDAATVPLTVFSADSLGLRVVREIDWSLAGSRAVAATGLALPVGTTAPA